MAAGQKEVTRLEMAAESRGQEFEEWMGRH